MNVRFIKEITNHINLKRTIIGECVYYSLDNGNRIKAYCDESGVIMQTIHKVNGKVDQIYLPFANYFEPKQCSPGAPKWNQHIDGDFWYFEVMYKHVVPKDKEYAKLAKAMEDYIKLFE